MRLLVAATALLVGLTSCGYRTAPSQNVTSRAAGPRPAPESDQPQPHGIVATVGSIVPFEDGNTAGTIMLKRIERIPAAQAGDADVLPSHGSFLVAQFKVVVFRGSVMTGPLTFQARTADGQTYPGEAGVVEYPLNPRKSLIAAGQQARGDVAFDVPKGPLLISYSPNGRPLASFKVVG